ncbi:MAG: AAA family ATPase [Pseudomonadota bacterium]
MFSGRGIPGTLSYAPWKEIYAGDSERKQDFAEAERTFEQMAEVYRQCGYELSELRRATPPARAQFILKQLHLDI